MKTPQLLVITTVCVSLCAQTPRDPHDQSPASRQSKPPAGLYQRPQTGGPYQQREDFFQYSTKLINKNEFDYGGRTNSPLQSTGRVKCRMAAGRSCWPRKCSGEQTGTWAWNCGAKTRLFQDRSCRSSSRGLARRSRCQRRLCLQRRLWPLP